AWIADCWTNGGSQTKISKIRFFYYPARKTLDFLEQILSSFFLVYSNRIYPASNGLDALYTLQEPDGAIRSAYDIETGAPIFPEDNPLGVTLPLLSWAEFNLYHKTANKKRVKEIMPILSNYYRWLEANFKMPNGLFSTPLSSTGMINSPRSEARYFIDFNATMAMNALYLSALGDILNDKDASFQYKRDYFSIKTRINSKMWNPEDGFYYDLDENEIQVRTKTLGTYWLLLAEIPNEERAEKLIAKLKDPSCFGTDNPFPSLSVDHPAFDKKGQGFRGSVFPWLTFMVIKGLEKYYFYELARNSAIRHLYYILDSMHNSDQEANKRSNHPTVWSAYQPMNEGKAIWEGHPDWPLPNHFPSNGLSTVTLIIENIIGLYISLPRKTVDWIIPNLEVMGIENLSLKRNMITILSSKSGRGWEIHMESEKLYYFTINVLGKKKKTLPIPSGKCSMLIDKI
ncbi:MAG TPA: trehalase family glycosidase, partial [Rectinema sp.]|nr:trehalase family glycosidase [Rectinema sp.]HQG14844.1 trehalase family glycosidase [Rectinema sp.]HQH87782.1 trehalase family glycosidase [Rectinema sp.]HQJ23090.1 trehalase family glycosidase [Rectinema sp.]HRU78480.1 trehalase family glycosidase [Rectinema sp.]